MSLQSPVSAAKNSTSPLHVRIYWRCLRRIDSASDRHLKRVEQRRLLRMLLLSQDSDERLRGDVLPANKVYGDLTNEAWNDIGTNF